MLKHSKLITEIYADSIAEKVFSLKSLFKNHADGKFSVLGAASYANSHQEYINIIKEINPILLEKFQDLFDIVKSYLEITTNKECFFDKNLSYPGFHIFYPNHADATLPLTSLHIDTPYELHKEYLIKNYSKINFDFPLTFTLALKLPKSGAGLYYWNKKGWELQNEEQSYEFYSDVYNKYINLFKDKTPSVLEFEKTLRPKYLKYFAGGINVFKGNLLHQIAPFFNPLDNEDIRII